MKYEEIILSLNRKRGPLLPNQSHSCCLQDLLFLQLLLLLNKRSSKFSVSDYGISNFKTYGEGTWASPNTVTEVISLLAKFFHYLYNNKVMTCSMYVAVLYSKRTVPDPYFTMLKTLVHLLWVPLTHLLSHLKRLRQWHQQHILFSQKYYPLHSTVSYSFYSPSFVDMYSVDSPVPVGGSAFAISATYILSFFQECYHCTQQTRIILFTFFCRRAQLNHQHQVETVLLQYQQCHLLLSHECYHCTLSTGQQTQQFTWTGSWM